MKKSLRGRMMLGFTILFFMILMILILIATSSVENLALYRDMEEFDENLIEVRETVTDYKEFSFRESIRESFGGLVLVVEENNIERAREVSPETISLMIEKLGDDLSYYEIVEDEIVMIGRLDDETVLISLKQLSILDEMSKMLNIYLGIASLIIFTILLVVTYYYIDYFERKMTFEAQKEILVSLGNTADAHFNETGDHIERVSHMMERFAKVLGFRKKECELLKLASTMHDIGKIAIPDEILKKPGILTPEERVIMQNHSTEGKRILGASNLPILKLASTIALYHHERVDGQGYPKGLKGDEIPESARMMAIIDVYDALTNDRVYKKAFPKDVAVGLMKKESGSQFDSQLLGVFMDNLDYITGDIEKS